MATWQHTVCAIIVPLWLVVDNDSARLAMSSGIEVIGVREVRGVERPARSSRCEELDRDLAEAQGTEGIARH